jgi:L-ascorbate metabolism protein UlaG (beta-lactamase superfamily)
MLIFLLLIAAVIIAGIIFLGQPMFGKNPVGNRLQQVKKSGNYKDGQFQNLSPTPMLSEGVGYYDLMKKFFFQINKGRKPPMPLPSIKTDLFALSPVQDVLVWFGHSSYFMQVDGKRFLVDPVLNGSASPVKATTRSFPGTDIYAAADIPVIDYLLVSHDHWDHLDYETIRQLRPRIKKLVCGLGMGQHFEHWGFNQEQVIEKDWGEMATLGDGFSVVIESARHFSGRGLKRNGSLWISFVLKTPSKKIFIGGDSGYGAHFRSIGEKHGPFDLAILECGQYDPQWKYIHMMPAEVIRAAGDLKAKQLMPVHWGKFALANHAWDDPIRALQQLAGAGDIKLVTPMIGEPVNLGREQSFGRWWETLASQG